MCCSIWFAYSDCGLFYRIYVCAQNNVLSGSASSANVIWIAFGACHILMIITITFLANIFWLPEFYILWFILLNSLLKCINRTPWGWSCECGNMSQWYNVLINWCFNNIYVHSSELFDMVTLKHVCEQDKISLSCLLTTPCRTVVLGKQIALHLVKKFDKFN